MTQIQVGSSLPQVWKVVQQESIDKYAEASGDFNPIHIDDAFARTSHYGRIVAHGMMGLAYISEMMTIAFGKQWLDTGSLKVRFRAPVYPADRIITFGSVKKVVDDGHYLQVECNVGCRKEGSEEVINGEASVKVPKIGMEG